MTASLFRLNPFPFLLESPACLGKEGEMRLERLAGIVPALGTRVDTPAARTGANDTPVAEEKDPIPLLAAPVAGNLVSRGVGIFLSPVCHKVFKGGSVPFHGSAVLLTLRTVDAAIRDFLAHGVPMTSSYKNMRIGRRRHACDRSI